MSVFKCKMCGGDLIVAENEKVVECEYCGSKQTVPNDDDEKKIKLFNRANRLRMSCEFDKAAGIYEQIIAEFPEESEAYWGLCLANYGIEYVDDPSTAKKIPTCHRASFEKLRKDENYELALENADMAARIVYENQAKEIDRIMGEILTVSRDEKPYDIFICYKETDSDGNRTSDSVLAQDIYDSLMLKGYRVFFSRITLEDKLGTQYEPYIFSALNSAKMMLVVGTDYEYMNAVWVKNEWSRFIKLMAKDKSKVMIPCYKDMDPYDMPDEFKPYQSQDCGKLGFMQDLTRGVDKIFGKVGQKKSAVEETTVSQNKSYSTTDSLLKRVFMFLEDGSWKEADEYCEKVLDIDPENAQAYLGKLMATQKVGTTEELSSNEYDFTKESNWKKAVKYANGQFTDAINEIAQKRADYLEAKEIEFKEVCHLVRRNDCPIAIVVGDNHTVGLKSDGTVVTTGGNKNGECNTEDWKNIVAVAAGESCTVGLKSDGTVVTTGGNIKGWKNIVAVAGGDYYPVGLKSDGTVVTTGDNENGACDTKKWENIVAVAAGRYSTVGLKSDGTVVATGYNYYGECNTKDWKNIIAVAGGTWHTVGLKSDGTVVATGYNENGECNTEDWKNIIAVAAGEGCTVGLKSDGTVVATGYNKNEACNTEDWKNIVAVAAGYCRTVGLKSDGTVVATGENGYGECNTEDWKNIIAVAAGESCTVGLKSDGTVVTAGDNEDEACNTEDWKNIVAVAAGCYRTVGLKSDGTVVATGDNEYGQCDKARNWKLFESVNDLKEAIARIAEEKEKAEEQKAEAEDVYAQLIEALENNEKVVITRTRLEDAENKKQALAKSLDEQLHSFETDRNTVRSKTSSLDQKRNELQSLNKKKWDVDREISDLEEQLASLGVFAISKKKELHLEIENLSDKRRKLSGDINELEKETDSIAAILSKLGSEADIDNREKTLMQDIEVEIRTADDEMECLKQKLAEEKENDKMRLSIPEIVSKITMKEYISKYIENDSQKLETLALFNNLPYELRMRFWRK